MIKAKGKEVKKGLTLTQVQEGLSVGIKKDGTKYSVRDSRARFFFPNEWNSFVTFIKPEKRLIFDTLLQTGARIEEALNIQPRDFDFERNNLTLRVTKIKAKKREKKGKVRTFPVSLQYIRKVKAHIIKNKIKDDEFLFKITKQAVWKMMRRGLKGCGIKDDWNFGLHNIRKTHGNWIKALGVPAEEICLRLGHDFDTYLKHYGSPNIFDRNDKVTMVKLLGEVYGFK